MTNKPIPFKLAVASLFLLLSSQCKNIKNPENETNVKGTSPSLIEVYLTHADRSKLLEKRIKEVSASDNNFENQIIIDPEKTFQTMQGFGFALTGGSAQHFQSMDTASRQELLEELFGRGPDQLGLSYIRISIGASDLDSLPFSYNDLPEGETDETMAKFSIEKDRTSLIPILKQILQINPDLNIMASPWSPPTWMKTNGATIGGSLKSSCYDAYALYFVKYILAMDAEGITIKAITLQNEPLHPGNNPSMHMTSKEQADFIKKSLGPLFREHHIDTKIVVYDHNADKPEYPIEVLSDTSAYPFIQGSAFHLYGGDVNDISKVHDAFPDKDLYLTEQWYSSEGKFEEDLIWHSREMIIGAVRNWASAVIEWNISSNPKLEPHTPGGCTMCLGAITLDGDQVTRNAGYYVMAHASSFVPPGSVRIESNLLKELPNVAFLTPDQKIVSLILNNTAEKLAFTLSQNNFNFSDTLQSGAVATYIWNKK